MNPDPLPTLREFQTGCKTLINVPIAAPSEAITFPARPVQGGRLELAPRKIGLWFAEPKYNGWRALLHLPSGAMWNRRGERLGIGDHFTRAIGQLRATLPDVEWLDCEALERRHKLGRGTLIVLDLVVPDLGYEARREILGSSLPVDPTAFGGNCPDHAALLVPSVPDHTDAAMALYQSLKDQNRRLGCDFFEGIVMKRAGSPYPIQRRSATQTFPGWCKSRFLS